MKALKNAVSILLIFCILISAVSISYAQDSTNESEFSLEITDLAVRSGINGEYTDDWYQYRNSGLNTGKKIFADRANQYYAIPDKFIDAAYVITKKADTSNKVFLDGNTPDWLKFNINQSATVYVVFFNPGNIVLG